MYGTRCVFAAMMLLLCGSAALAQPANDPCGAPIPISGLGVTPFDTNGSAMDGVDNQACTFFSVTAIYNDIWYCWTATATGPVKARLCGATFDTKLAVYAGCTPCPEAGGIIVCNDDSCGLQSEAAFSAVSGQQYLIRVGSYAATGFGTGSLELAPNVVPTIGGPIVNPANNHTYYLLDRASWTSCEATAVTLGGHLATINDAAENEWVRQNLANFGGVDRRVWIGYNDAVSEGTFAWVSGESASYTNWNGGEPNDSGGVEDFGELFGSNGQWNDNRDVPTSAIVYGAVEVAPPPSCPADFDQNGQVQPADVALFVSVWFTSVQNGTLAGDFDGNGATQPADVALFVSVWFAAVQSGC